MPRTGVGCYLDNLPAESPRRFLQFLGGVVVRTISPVLCHDSRILPYLGLAQVENTPVLPPGLYFAPSRWWLLKAPSRGVSNDAVLAKAAPGMGL